MDGAGRLDALWKCKNALGVRYGSYRRDENSMNLARPVNATKRVAGSEGELI